MTAEAETLICTSEGCSPDGKNAFTPPRVPAAMLELAVVSDTICPWCYVGKRRMDRAIEELAREGIVVSRRWLPFELNPQMPAGGMNRKEYRSAKFGSWENSQSLDAQVTAEGSREGIAFRHDLMERTPNTRASHRLVWLARQLGGWQVENRLVEALFSAYFCEGRDVGDAGVLTEIAVAAGLPVLRIEALLAGNDGLADVLRHEAWATSAGIRGVPSVIAGTELLFSGAQRTPLIVRTLREMAVAQAAAAPGEVGLDARA